MDKCVVCGKPLKPSSHPKQTCDRKCGSILRWQRRGTVAKLPPGDHFVDGRWWIYYTSGQRKKAVERTCAVCGTLFRTTEAQVKSGGMGGTFCSHDCGGKGLASVRIGIRKNGYSKPGDSKTRKDGYILERVSSNDPFVEMSERRTDAGTPTGWILQHRLVMARSLGRVLERHEQVHHINGDKSDNRLENLQLRMGPHGNGRSARCADCGSRHIIFDEIA